MDQYPVAMDYGRRLKGFMYDALEKTNPAAKAELDKTRGQYSNYLKLKKVAPANAEGLLEPNRVAATIGKEDSDSDIRRFAQAGALLPTYTQATAPAKDAISFATRHPALAIAGGLGLGGVGEFAREHMGAIMPYITGNLPLAGFLAAEGGSYGIANALRNHSYANPGLVGNILENTARGAPMGALNPSLLGVTPGTKLKEQW
jgi:hypothetical protein